MARALAECPIPARTRSVTVSWTTGADHSVGVGAEKSSGTSSAACAWLGEVVCVVGRVEAGACSGVG